MKQEPSLGDVQYGETCKALLLARFIICYL